jgi:phage/plasmid-like protein (TIGR03299 family)
MRTETPWNRVFDPVPTSIEHALVMAGLDWEVLSKPAFFLDNPEYDDEGEHPEFLDVPNYFVNIRSDNKQPLGVVTTRYSPFHNIQAFAWLSSLFATEMEFVAAGDFMNSRRVWVLMRLPDYIEVAGEKIGQYAFVHTSHDGKHSVTASMTPYLVSSATLLTTELRRARDYNAKRTIAIRHTGIMEDKMAQIEEAQRVLGFSINYYKQFAEFGQKMADIQVPGEKDISAYIETLLPIDDDKMGERAIRNTEISRERMKSMFLKNTKAKGSWWALYTAAIEYADWVRPQRKADGRFQRAIDDPDSFKSTAFDLALGGAGL